MYVVRCLSQEHNIDPNHIGTQEDQDETDEKARTKAMNELVASWMDRLQLISVIVRLFRYQMFVILIMQPIDHLFRSDGIATTWHHSARPGQPSK